MLGPRPNKHQGRTFVCDRKYGETLMFVLTDNKVEPFCVFIVIAMCLRGLAEPLKTQP